MTQAELISLYKSNGGKLSGKPEENDAFNKWADGLAQTQGVDNWDKVQNPSTYRPPTSENPYSPSGTNQPTSPLNSAIDNALYTGAVASGTGGNTRQVQGGNQTGTFDSSGTQAQTSNTGQVSSGSNTMNQATTGTQTQAGESQGLTAQTGKSTTGVVDTLGFGDLLKGQAGAATTNDTTRNAYLSDLVNTGGSNFNDQVAAATNQAMSGPGMQGVGQAAQGRAVGSAVSQVARNNQGERLAASNQLAGPTATTNLAGAGNAYLGQTNDTSNIGTNLGKTSTTGTTASNTTGSATNEAAMSGFSDLLNNQSSTGTSNASNRQVAYGDAPEQKTSGGGGSVVCTALGERGLLPRWMLEAELVHVQNNPEKFKTAAKGYYSYGVRLAKMVRKSKLIAYLCLPFAKGCAYEAARQDASRNLPFFLGPALCYYTFFLSNFFIGLFIPGEPVVKDAEIRQMLQNAHLELNFS
jgi:hypothetical protein